MKRTLLIARIFAALGALLALGSAFAHGRLARTAVLGRLPTDLAADTREGLNAAWILGSAAMVTFALMVLAGLPALGRDPSARNTTAIAGLFFLAYGAWALTYRHFQSHYFGFIAIGALMIAGAALAGRSERR